MGQSTDQIAEELERTRAGAAEKLEKIEDQVTQTAESVKDSMDLRRQVEERPLLSLGAAFMGGIILGGLLGGEDNDRHGARYRGDDSNGHPYAGSKAEGGGLGEGIMRAVKSSGLEDTLTAAVAAAMSTAGDRVRTSVDHAFPGFAEKYESTREADGGLTDRMNAATGESHQAHGPA